jgi:PPOX class probable F420-dependent enzyme
MSGEEAAGFVADQRVVICATNGPHGYPHLMPLWYVVRDGEVWTWTYAKSQKVRNLERDPRATLQIEAGEEYQELRGVMIEAHTEIRRDPGLIVEFGAELMQRYGAGATGPDFMEAVRAQAAKRVALQFVPRRVASWDHRKLEGVY